jgi:predicted dehydrogenase
MARIGIGVLSYAHGHAHTYCQQLVKDDDVHLVACWDDDKKRGQEAAARYGMRYSPHPEDVLSDPAIQAVILTMETSRHAEFAVAAAQAKKEILLQKPMALSLADCDRIIAAVERAGVRLMMAFQMRRDPVNLKMKALLDEGAIGRVGILRRRHCLGVLFSEGFVNGPTRWHIDPEKNMGMWMDDAVHAADFLYWFLGRPVSVSAEIDNILTHVAPDDTGVALYRYPDGALATLFNSSVILAGENTTEIYGDGGVIIQNYGDGPSTSMAEPGDVPLKLYRRGEGDGRPPGAPRWEKLDLPIPASQGDRIAAVPRPFVEMLLHERQPDVTARDGRVSVEMILGAYQAAREGRRVSFPLE